MDESVIRHRLVESAIKYDINKLFEKHKAYFVEFLLEYLDVSTLPSTTIVTITNVVKHHENKINNYHYWYEKCLKEFNDRGHDTSKLLTKD